MAIKQKIRLGMVGGGEGAFIGAVHRYAAGLDSEYELVCGAFSRDAGNNARSGEKLGLSADRVYASWQQLIEQESKLPAASRIQALTIVTPNHLHVPITIAAMAAGIHVFCEKPAAVSLEEAVELKAAISSAPVLYGLAHTYLGYPQVWQARHMVASGQLGKIRKVYVEYPQGWLSENIEGDNKQASWRTDPAQAGGSGCMADIGTHAFGLVEFVLGQKVTSLCADMYSHIDGRQLDDDGAAFIRTDGGATGVLIASQVCAGEENPLKIRVYGDKGGMEWQQMTPDTLIYRPLGAPYQVLRSGLGQPGLCEDALARCRVPSGHPEGYLEAMANLLTDFAAAIRAGETGKAEGVPGLASGVRGMAFIDAMINSSQAESAWVQVADLG